MKKIYYIILFPFFLYACENSISEYQSQNFVKFFGNGFESKGYDIINLTNGGYAFTGYDKNSMGNYQVLITKIDKNGNTIWDKTYGNSYREEGKVIKEVSDGFLVAGTTLNNSGITHSFVLSLSSTGDSLWSKEYGDANTSVIINDIIITDNNIFLAGKSYSVDENKSDCYVSKLDKSGNVLWQRTYYEGTNSLFRRVFQQDNNLLLVGTTYDVDGIFKVTLTTIKQSYGTLLIPKFQSSSINQYTEDALNSNYQQFILLNQSELSVSNCIVVKYNSSYQEEWRTESIQNIEGKSFTAKSDGSLILCGEQLVDGNPTIKLYRIEPSGQVNDVEFSKTFSGYVGRIIETSDNGVIMIGTTPSTYGTMVQLIKTGKDLFLLKN